MCYEGGVRSRGVLLLSLVLAAGGAASCRGDDGAAGQPESSTDPSLPATPSASEGVLEPGALPATSIGGESIKAGAFDLRAVAKIADHGRWKVSCTFDLPRLAHLCATDMLDADWKHVGTRVFEIGAKDFSIHEHVVSPDLFSSYLWGDFDADGLPDLLGFRDAEELFDPAKQPPVVLLRGTADPGRFEPGEPVPFPHAAKAGAVLDANGDGCADVLVLGSGIEKDVEKGDVTYFPDALLAGDCAGHFRLANDETGLDRIPGFIGHPDRTEDKLGRTAVVTDLDDDGCPDLLVGNYRGFPNDALVSDCNGRFRRDGKHPATGIQQQGAYWGHTVAIAPVDLEGRGMLDLGVANLWHPDDRGASTDPANVLVHDESGAWKREEIPYFLEAPFGFSVVDLDQDGTHEWLFATGERWGAYKGRAAIAHHGAKNPIWKDTTGWLTMREAPAAVDLNLDGYLEWAGDSRIFASYARESGAAGHWLGLAFRTPMSDAGKRVVLSGMIVRIERSDGRRFAYSLASDGRGQPASLVTVPLGDGAAHAVRAEVAFPPSGKTMAIDLGAFATDRYHVVTLTR